MSEIIGLFPLYLLLLVFFPFLTLLISNYAIADSRYVVINLVWLTCILLPYYLTRKPWIYRTVVLFYFVFGFLNMVHLLLLNGPITLTSILVLLNTNQQEAVEFFKLKESLKLLCLLPYTTVFYLALKKKAHWYNFLARKRTLGICLLLAAIFIVENAYNERLVRKGMPQLMKVGFSFYENRVLYNGASANRKVIEINATSQIPYQPQTCIVIIGESCSRNHLSLYGYKRKTNPKLELRKDLAIYTDVISAYSNTLNSVISMLSESKPYGDKQIEVDVIDAFHSVGFKTYWLSNQSPIGIWDNVITEFASKSDKTVFVNTSSNTSFETTYKASYDEKLIEPLKEVLKEKVDKKFIVVHLLGSHASYDKRYTSEFDYFEGSTEKEKTIATYDNSVLYNDFIVDSIISLVSLDTASRPSSTAIVYLSDHGENVYDFNENVGHDFAGMVPKVNVEIPFLIWLSSTFKEKNPELTIQANSNVRMPFMTDHLFHSLLDLNKIESSFLIRNRSIFSAVFNQNRQRTLEDGEEYDLK